MVVLLIVTIAGVWAWARTAGGIIPARPVAPSPPRNRPKVEAGAVVVAAETAKSMRLSARSVRAATRSMQLRMTGQLMLDPNRLVHVASRFGGEVVHVGCCELSAAPLRVGQRVEKGQLLAVIWCKEIGEKKSDLVDALSQLYLHETIYKRLTTVGNTGAVPGRTLDEARQKYESDVIHVERIRRTLLSWRIPESEIKAIEQEAQRIHASALAGHTAAPGKVEVNPPNLNWANTEIRAPMTGVILERNLTVGEIVDPNADLFKIADLSQLMVMANIYEEDLPALLSLTPEERFWRIRLSSQPTSETLSGTIELIGNIVDANQHTAVVQGLVDNTAGRLRVGQFIEAIVALPAPEGKLEVPLAAVIDNGNQSHVMLAAAQDLTRWTPLRVIVHRRTANCAWIEPVEGRLDVGDQVNVQGGVELMKVWQGRGPNPVSASRPPKAANDHTIR